MANYKIEEIEGIGPVLGEKLRTADITTTDKLLLGTKTKKQRKELAEATGIAEKKILKFANMADLFRISGVGQEYAELLEVAGVDTVPELAMRNAENLTAKMEEVNEAKNLTRRTPSLKEVEKWVAEAKSLPRALEY
jgi:predicted flap endonuclease-1-like 5' DNA nuclease